MVNVMNETIGVKGGKNDKRRSIIITAKNKQKLKDAYQQKKKLQLKKLEKEVKRTQLASFLIAVPISIAGNVLTTIMNQSTKDGKEKDIKKDFLSQEKLELEESATYIEENESKFINHVNPKTIDENNTVKGTPTLERIVKTAPPSIVATSLSLTENNQKIEKIERLEEAKQDTKSNTNTENTIALTQTEKKEELPQFSENKIWQRIQERGIVEKYEEKLKEVRQQLKELIYEYNVLVKEANKVEDSKEAENILYQLSILISKIEQLKEKLKIEMNDLEKDPLIEEMIDSYMEDLKNNHSLDKIKDSNLYEMIQQKLEEISDKTNHLNIKVEDKKDTLTLTEDKFNILKENYYDYENFNNQLVEMQYEQDYLLKDLEQKIKNSVSVTEKVSYRLQILNRQSNKLKRLISLPALIPGNRSAKAISSATASYLFFAKNILRPRLKKTRYRVISVANYSKEIENGITKVEDAINMIKKTSSKLEEIIKEIERDFKDFDQSRELLNNLKKIATDLKIKEEELEKTKKNQEKLLEENNRKVKTLERTEPM